MLKEVSHKEHDNEVSGPILRQDISLKKDIVSNDEKPWEIPNQITNALERILPDGILKEAILRNPEAFSFRCFVRKSNDEPYGVISDNATVSIAEANIQEYGIETGTGDAASFIKPGKVWWRYLYPPQNDPAANLSYLMVYQRTPYINEGMKDNYAYPYVDPERNMKYTYAELREKNVPTLRDILLGYVVIHWE